MLFRSVARHEAGEALGVAHQFPPVATDALEAFQQALLLRGFPVVQRDALGVLAQAHQAETEIGL